DPQQHPRHKTQCNCACPPCRTDRALGCESPHKCALAAQKIINKLTPKTNPNTPGHTDGLSLTHTRKEKNNETRTNGMKGIITFDPMVTCKTDLAECFRIFTDPDQLSDTP
ncbi:hypothetical protein DENSPDRAFT_752023, partial [Dentipellis sp. KUC8613]